MYEAVPLPYPYEALVPFLSSLTLQVHYNEHYLSYLKKLNDLLQQNHFDFQTTKESLFQNIDQFPISARGPILYYAGGVLNHELYFSCMSPKKQQPQEPFKSALIRKFGSVDRFYDTFLQHAKAMVGSGYTFLAVDSNGELVLLNLANQESPYQYGMIPILSLDLWEHAYYLDYQNRKEDYVHGFLDHLNFAIINDNYQQALDQFNKNL